MYSRPGEWLLASKERDCTEDVVVHSHFEVAGKIPVKNSCYQFDRLGKGSLSYF
jgi:hypothetical protein